MENCKFTTSRSVKRYKFLFVLAIFLSSFLSVYAEDVSNYCLLYTSDAADD